MPRSLRFATHSLATRLALIGLCAVVFGAVVRYFFVSDWLRQDLEKLVNAERLATAEFVASDVDYKLRERQAMLSHMAATVPTDALAQPERLRAWLAERHELLPLFSLGFMVLDPSQVVLVDYPTVPGRVGGKSALASVVSHAEARAVEATQPVVDPSSHQPALMMSAPIRGASGNPLGTLVALSTISSMDLLGSLKTTNGGGNSGGSLLLISPRDHLFVASTTASMTFKPTPQPGVNLLHDRAMAGYRGTGITVNAAGVEELSAMVSVPSAGWLVVARIPTADAFAAVARSKLHVLQGSAINLCFVLIFVFLAIRWSLKPLFDAASQADAMTLGNAPLQPLPVVRDDEIGHLTVSFNRLLAKLVQSQVELSHMAHHDGLTGLPNRRLLSDRLLQALARSRRQGTRVALMAMDLDDFKPINDAHGHEMGDKALHAIALRFVGALRQGDTLARVGGDEFALLAPDLGGDAEQALAAAQVIAAKCVAIAQQPLMIDGIDIQVGVSIGLVMGDGQCDPDRLYATADRAMYLAKQGGRGRYAVASPLERHPA